MTLNSLFCADVLLMNYSLTVASGCQRNVRGRFTIVGDNGGYYKGD